MGYRIASDEPKARVQRRRGPTPNVAGPSLTASSATIQRAGHAEDLCFLSGSRWIVKRMDVTETNEYVGFSDGVNRPPSMPDFHGPYYSVRAVRAALTELGQAVNDKQVTKLNTMAEEIARGGRSFMILSSAKQGSGDAGLRDLKLGQYSASGTDQQRRGKNKLGSLAKTGQHDWMDKVSGSRERGFRDEDAWKNASGWDKVKNASKVKRENLNPLKGMLDGAPPAALSAIERDVFALYFWIKNADPIYVGMSVLIVVNPDNPRRSNATAIDFEHPIFAADRSFATHREGLLLGLSNMLDLVQAAHAYQAPHLPEPTAPIPIPHGGQRDEEEETFHIGGPPSSPGPLGLVEDEDSELQFSID